MPKVIPFLLFEKDAEIAAKYYTSLLAELQAAAFKEAAQIQSIAVAAGYTGAFALGQFVGGPITPQQWHGSPQPSSRTYLIASSNARFAPKVDIGDATRRYQGEEEAESSQGQCETGIV